MRPRVFSNKDALGRQYGSEAEGRILRCGDYVTALVDLPDVDLIFTSPPYNIGSKAERQDGQRKQGKYDPKSFGSVRSYPDHLPEDLYQQSQRAFLAWGAAHLRPMGVIVYNHKPRHRDGVLIKPESWFPADLVQIDEVVWDRGSTHNHCKSFLYQTTERLYILQRRDSVERGVRAFFATDGMRDVWKIEREFRKGKLHDATFPLALAQRVIRLWSPTDGLVCDPYSGSGTTMLAAAIEGRRFYGSELMSCHFEAAEGRYQELCGAKQMLVGG